jgi:hypothetical protein
MVEVFIEELPADVWKGNAGSNGRWPMASEASQSSEGRFPIMVALEDTEVRMITMGSKVSAHHAPRKKV